LLISENQAAYETKYESIKTHLLVGNCFITSWCFL